MTTHVPTPTPARRPAAAGFTLIELTVSLGLLGGFVLFLVQLLSTSISVFEEGETGQETADRVASASTAVEGAFADLLGDPTATERRPPTARLLVQWVPLGFAAAPETPHVQIVRASVRLSEGEEERLLRRKLLPEAQRTARTSSDADVAERLERLVATTPRIRRGEMLLVPWPAGDFLELRRGLFLPDQRIPIDEQRDVALFEPETLGGVEFPPEAILAATEPFASGLLHFEIRFRSQYTKDFESLAANEGPEFVWDSARAGLLSSEDAPTNRRFTLDLGPASLDDASDDVFPRAVQIRITVARDMAETILVGDLGARDVDARIANGDALPDVPFLKIGAEWVRRREVRTTQLTGLERGLRGSKPSPHPAGTPVRAGRPTLIVVPLLHGRDAWNG